MAAPERLVGRGRKRLAGVLVTFTVPRELAETIRRAADAQYELPASYCRRIVVERLRQDGLLPKLDPTAG